MLWSKLIWWKMDDIPICLHAGLHTKVVLTCTCTRKVLHHPHYYALLIPLPMPAYNP